MFIDLIDLLVNFTPLHVFDEFTLDCEWFQVLAQSLTCEARPSQVRVVRLIPTFYLDNWVTHT